MSEAEQIERLKRIIEEQKITISQISHEVRNPVTVINSSLQLIEKKCPAIREYPLWQDTMRDMKYLLRLLDEVSSYNNSTLLRKEVLDTSTWLSGFLSSLSRTVPAPFSLSWQVPPALPAICADPLKLRRALENLLRNGFEALEDQGEVSFLAEAKKDALCLRISDTGCGIPQEDIPNMFQRFSQGTTKKRSAGTGLGLYLSRQIIESHGGKIWLESVLNKGSEFSFLLTDSVKLRSLV